MIDPRESGRISQALPFLAQSDPGQWREFSAAAFLARIPAGRDVFMEGDRVDAIALLISGVVRVYKLGVSGREITLYRFGNGSSCILTANAILSQQEFPAIATVEKDAEAVMIPALALRDWVKRHDLWRDFVYNLLSQRLASVMELVEEVAFQRMDARLAALLLNRSSQHARLEVTHQELAAELGSSREVISRLLEDLSARGILAISRGHLDILDRSALGSLYEK